ncbi:arsenate-mycothiol transferase ArsC [Flaviflexus massiliensis]|uniref:arsenate-mycothiol transferase ArsC n=1 Tax=Flaviflexus massiliensis TaxID=1522309 RepID=UPI0006D59980|nr:low molecular weight phosphatase family protein [Flaviflexus massiliensis]
MVSVLFVCVKNGGKSQMAGALMRAHSGGSVETHTCGTKPGHAINELSQEVIEELGASMAGEYPKGIDPMVVASVDRVVILGTEANPDEFAAAKQVEIWDIDEPSLRGIDGVGRMRLVRDDISTRVRHLYDELTQ